MPFANTAGQELFSATTATTTRPSQPRQSMRYQAISWVVSRGLLSLGCAQPQWALLRSRSRITRSSHPSRTGWTQPTFLPAWFCQMLPWHCWVLAELLPHCSSFSWPSPVPCLQNSLRLHQSLVPSEMSGFATVLTDNSSPTISSKRTSTLRRAASA